MEEHGCRTPCPSHACPRSTSLTPCSAQQRGRVDVGAGGGEQAGRQGVHKRVGLVTITSEAEGHGWVAPGEGAVEERSADEEVVEGVREGEAARQERDGGWGQETDEKA